MKNTRQLLFLILGLVVIASCTKIKESPEPSDTSGGTGGGGGGGGGGGNPAVYVGLWKMTDKTVASTSVFASLDTIKEIHLQAAATATWNYYSGNNLVDSESDIYTLNTSSSPATIVFANKGGRTIVNKTGNKMSWSFNDPDFGNAEVVEEFTKQ